MYAFIWGNTWFFNGEPLKCNASSAEIHLMYSIQHYKSWFLYLSPIINWYYKFRIMASALTRQRLSKACIVCVPEFPVLGGAIWNWFGTWSHNHSGDSPLNGKQADDSHGLAHAYCMNQCIITMFQVWFSLTIQINPVFDFQQNLSKVVIDLRDVYI